MTDKAKTELPPWCDICHHYHGPGRHFTADEWLFKRCLDALNEEALATDDWKRPVEKCPAWYELRAELRKRLYDVWPAATKK